MSWGSQSLSLPRVLKQLGAGISREIMFPGKNIFSFPQEHIPSAPCPGSVPWSCPVGCTEGTGSPIPRLSAFPSNEPTPFKAAHCGFWPPNFILALSIQSLSQ